MFLKLCYHLFGVRCPICCENLGGEPFCSKHGYVGGFKPYNYNFFVVKFKLFFLRK